MGLVASLPTVQWHRMPGSDRRWLGQTLRRAGLRYGEIMSLLPVPKGTLAGWCRGIELTEAQKTAIRTRTAPRKGTARDTQHRRRAEIETIKANATDRARTLVNDPLWVAGVALYWGEGSKTSNELALANSDPRLLRLFISWTRAYIDRNADFVLKLTLHRGDDEVTARRWWSDQLGLAHCDFHKTFVKPQGTGHRKNRLIHGVCLVRMRRSTNAYHAAMSWIDALAGSVGDDHC